MGENADDMIEGRACSHCGAYFVREETTGELFEHGYPVLCRGCFDDCTKKQRGGLPPSADGVIAI